MATAQKELKPCIDPTAAGAASVWSRSDLAYQLRCSESNVDAMTRAKQLPPPHKMGASKRWRVDVIQAWQLLGMPPCDHLYSEGA